MRLVVDANALFSAFLRDGLTRAVWFDPRLEIYAPEFLLEEFKKYEEELIERTGVTRAAATETKMRLTEKIMLVGAEELRWYADAAKHLARDEKDAPYVACALAVEADLWSRDTHLTQPRVRVWSTAELARELGYLKT